jgi:hypothetical protein
MRRAGGRAALAALPLALFVFAPARAETRSDLRFLPAYFTGEFGTGIGTDILYLPLIYTATSPRSELRLTAPFLVIHTDEPVTYVGGEVVPGGPGGETTQSGPGDVIVQGEYFFRQGGPGRSWISGSLRVKLPTADEDRGLGTGEVDVGPGVAIIRPLGGSVTLMGQAQYIVRGDPPSADFRDTLWLLAALQARPSPGTAVNLLLERRESVIRGRDAIRSLGLGYDRRLSEAVTLRTALFVGLSDTAEDWGVSAGISLRGAPRP